MFRSKSTSKSKSKSKSPATEKPIIPINVTKTFFIPTHTSFTKNIKIYDLPGQLASEPGTDAYKKEVKAIADTIAKDKPSPYLEITASSFWASRYVLSRPSSISTERAELAEWRPSLFAGGVATFAFPVDSPHATHPLDLKPIKWYSTTEQFVMDSVTFQWKMHGWAEMRYTLFKLVGTEKREVGKYWQSGVWTTGGVVELDTGEVEEVVALLTGVAVMRKKRQRDWERSA